MENLIPVIQDPKKYPKAKDGEVFLVQSRMGSFIAVEQVDGNPSIIFPKFLGLCQACNNTTCKFYDKIKFFSSCSFYKGLTKKELKEKIRIELEKICNTPRPKE